MREIPKMHELLQRLQLVDENGYITKRSYRTALYTLNDLHVIVSELLTFYLSPLPRGLYKMNNPKSMVSLGANTYLTNPSISSPGSRLGQSNHHSQCELLFCKAKHQRTATATRCYGRKA
jgi:hypothetical protein